MKNNAYVGSWSFRPEKKGLSRFEMDPETGKLTWKETILEHVSVGALFLDEEKDVLYAADEGGRFEDLAETGGVHAVKLNEDGSFSEVRSFTPSLNPKTSYIWKAEGSPYLVISNHSSSKAVKRAVLEGGLWRSETVYDQASVNVIRLDEAGLTQQVCGALVFDAGPADGTMRIPHLHNVMADPEGKMFISCDKGMDRIITFRLDEASGTPELLAVTACPDNTAPRYSVFHPAADIVFTNNENWPGICAFRYERQTGRLDKIGEVLIGDAGDRTMNASDLVLSEKGDRLYAALRTTNEIAVLAVGEDGSLALIQRAGCGGEGPRGLYRFGPYLYCLNLAAGRIACFTVRDDGTLAEGPQVFVARLPGSMVIRRGKQ